MEATTTTTTTKMNQIGRKDFQRKDKEKGFNLLVNISL